ncbi:MAG: sensor histidine kinase, partial [Acidimicrobiia bacterium]|nr:sensor histidine kinase [Acidimicrobiia bacterium]
RAAELRQATDEERARIARELHDVIAHHLSVIAVQAGAARLLAEQNDNGVASTADRDAWGAVESIARQALTEMRQLLGVLRHEAGEPPLAPPPGLDQLNRLLDEVRGAGLPVDARIEGDAIPLPPAVDLSAYRILQEALTNVLKHEGPAPTHVLLRYGDGELAIELVDEGRLRPVSSAPDPVQGHGLVGMRERVAMFGGRLDAGSRAEGGFAVVAHIPLNDHQR